MARVIKCIVINILAIWSAARGVSELINYPVVPLSHGGQMCIRVWTLLNHIVSYKPPEPVIMKETKQSNSLIYMFGFLNVCNKNPSEAAGSV